MKAREKSEREKERQEKGKEEDIRTEEILDQLVCFLNFLFMCMSDVIGVSAIRGQKRTSAPLALELEEVMIVLRGCWEQISMEDYRSPRGTLSSHSLRGCYSPPLMHSHIHLYLKDFIIVIRILKRLSAPSKRPNTELWLLGLIKRCFKKVLGECIFFSICVYYQISIICELWRLRPEIRATQRWS